ncbi:MAG TPA: hypothetical protein PLB89_04950 [Flavobacteriales bacterium]|nr:hypothetical protein [Flavobacteriales bacterium]
MSKATYDHTLILALADVLNNRPLGEMKLEAADHRNHRRTDEATAIEDALVLAKFGVEFSKSKMERLLVDMAKPKFYPKPARYTSLPADRTIFISISIDAPWMRNVQQIPLDISCPDILRAFAPLPREHDLQEATRSNDPFQEERFRHEFDRIRKQRDEFQDAIVQELLKKLKQWQEEQDPVKGILPENILP